MSFQFRNWAKLTQRDSKAMSKRSQALTSDLSEPAVHQYVPVAPSPENLSDSGFSYSGKNDLRGSLRRRVQIHAEIRESGGGRYNIWVTDISQTGFRMQLLRKLEADRGVLLILPGMKPLRGRIAWRDGSYYGAMFEHPLHIAVFDHISRVFEGA